MTPTDFEVAILTLFCWQRGESYGLDVMVATANLIKNLAAQREIGLLDAITEHESINCLEPLGDDVYPDTRNPVFAKLLHSVADVYYKRSDDITNGAIYVLDLSKPLDEELRAEVLGNPDAHPMSAIIGRFKYFR